MVGEISHRVNVLVKSFPAGPGIADQESVSRRSVQRKRQSEKYPAEKPSYNEEPSYNPFDEKKWNRKSVCMNFKRKNRNRKQASHQFVCLVSLCHYCLFKALSNIRKTSSFLKKRILLTLLINFNILLKLSCH